MLRDEPITRVRLRTIYLLGIDDIRLDIFRINQCLELMNIVIC